MTHPLFKSVREVASSTIARYGQVHILVNNAEVTGGGVYGAWTDAAWDWTIDVNLMAVVWGIEIFGPFIEQHGEGGHIVQACLSAHPSGDRPLSASAASDRSDASVYTTQMPVRDAR
jgi:NAD(P)-dependent dehydrogenase (short-subunit alcohol dehydrogenase family)